jgi:3-methyladenine DNA glycosylase AlkC
MHRDIERPAELLAMEKLLAVMETWKAWERNAIRRLSRNCALINQLRVWN